MEHCGQGFFLLNLCGCGGGGSVGYCLGQEFNGVHGLLKRVCIVPHLSQQAMGGHMLVIPPHLNADVAGKVRVYRAKIFAYALGKA